MNGTSLVFTGHEPTSEKPQAFGIHPGSPVPWTSRDDKLQRVTLTPQALDFIQNTLMILVIQSWGPVALHILHILHLKKAAFDLELQPQVKT